MAGLLGKPGARLCVHLNRHVRARVCDNYQDCMEGAVKKHVFTLLLKNQSSFRFTRTLREGAQMSLRPRPLIHSPHCQHAPQKLPLSHAEPALTRRHHPKPTVYITLHSHCCALRGLGRMHKDAGPTSHQHSEPSHRPETLGVLIPPRPLPHPRRPPSLPLSPRFCLFQKDICWGNQCF